MSAVQAVEQDCNNLGALLQRMLGLLSKPQAAAELFAKEHAAKCTAAGSDVAAADGSASEVHTAPVEKGATAVIAYALNQTSPCMASSSGRCYATQAPLCSGDLFGLHLHCQFVFFVVVQCKPILTICL